MKAKFKVGQYVAAPNTVCLKISAILNIDGDMPVYGMFSPKSKEIRWETQYETDEGGLEVIEPNFKAYQNIKVGDVLRVGSPDETNAYVQVLARVDDLCLLSQKPHDHEEVKVVEKLSEQIKEMTGGEVEVMSQSDKDRLAKHSSLTYNQKIASHWVHIDTLALMNWPIVSEG